MRKCFLLLLLSSIAHALPTYFTYVEPKGSSDFVITEESLEKWIPYITPVLNTKSEKKDDKTLHYFTYLYIAERDAAFLSHNTHGCFEGSLDPLILKITQLFYPKMQTPKNFESDPYSEDLATIVFTKFQQRYNKSRKDEWILWYPNTYEVPPPSNNVNIEIKAFHQMRSNITEKQKATAKQWEKVGKPDEKNWFTIANDYMEEENVAFGKRLQVRAVLALALSDADAIAMRAKKKYKIPRPFQVDPDFNPLISKPRSMSYPSGHSALASAGAEVMCVFYPDECKRWSQLAHECAYSRLYGGVHYPMDIKEGLIIGKEAAKEVVSNQEID